MVNGIEGLRPEDSGKGGKEWGLEKKWQTVRWDGAESGRGRKGTVGTVGVGLSVRVMVKTGSGGKEQTEDQDYDQYPGLRPGLPDLHEVRSPDVTILPRSDNGPPVDDKQRKRICQSFGICPQIKF